MNRSTLEPRSVRCGDHLRATSNANGIEFDEVRRRTAFRAIPAPSREALDGDSPALIASLASLHRYG
jgi:hypothetical protein